MGTKSDVKNGICQCCGMPLDEETKSRNVDGSVNDEYCKWCYVDGKFTYDNMDELIEVCVQHMVGKDFTEEQARAYLKDTLPKLSYWSNAGN